MNRNLKIAQGCYVLLTTLRGKIKLRPFVDGFQNHRSYDDQRLQIRNKNNKKNTAKSEIKKKTQRLQK